MTTANSKFRFVRCPKCSKILMEIDEVPLYQCGGCGITIQAKKHSSVANNLHRGSIEVHCADTSRNEIGQVSGTGKNESRTRFDSVESLRLDEDIPTLIEGHQDELSREGSDGIRVSQKAEMSNTDNSSMRSSSSQAYDGSSPDNTLPPDNFAGNRPPKNYKLLSRRTFRNKNFTNSSSNNANDEDNKVDDHMSHTKDRSLSSMSAKERHFSISSKRFYSSFNTYKPESSFNSAFEDLMPPEYHGVDHLELLKKVEELMHQLSNLSVDGVDSSRGSRYVGRFPHRRSYNWSRETVHQKHLNHKDVDVEINRSKNKRSVAKRHCLPLMSGAPFVICNKCFQLLQLPADFLATGRRSQKLQCGACSEVNVYTPSTAKSATVLLRDQSDGGFYSDDYGLSSSNSYSTDPDSVLLAPHNYRAVTVRPSSSAFHQLLG